MRDEYHALDWSEKEKTYLFDYTKLLSHPAITRLDQSERWR